ncbi:hypothetical protein SADUNF_Sadunf01G0145000 [Salix dunnii]|uniref:Lipoyl-binding domain-containing protein n=1 Tax=Salix dunnii TaxID=1413687 RepID=A0A835NB70_9ROSI|nr:hypothetical protein SADUNF_Sadunf01G0145000 [Salix dunnii]
MASCSLGASNMKLSKLDFGRATVGNLQKHRSLRMWRGRGRLQHAGVAISHKSREAFRSCGSALETQLTTKETKPLDLSSQVIPNSSEIESLVTEISNTTSISEFELKLGGFRLYVRRDLNERNKATHQPLPAPPPAASLAIAVNTTTGASDLNGSFSTSLAISKQEPSSGGIKSFLDRAADEGLMILRSPRVGFFRRCRTIKGKRAPPQCKEVQVHEGLKSFALVMGRHLSAGVLSKSTLHAHSFSVNLSACNVTMNANNFPLLKQKQTVKEGQVLCFIEQLGGELPIETDISGEVIRILRDDGEPVGYGDALIAILPSFPGIKKLQ